MEIRVPLGMLLTDLSECFKLLPTMDIPKVSKRYSRTARRSRYRIRLLSGGRTHLFIPRMRYLICQNEEIDSSFWHGSRKQIIRFPSVLSDRRGNRPRRWRCVHARRRHWHSRHAGIRYPSIHYRILFQFRLNEISTHEMASTAEKLFSAMALLLRTPMQVYGRWTIEKWVSDNYRIISRWEPTSVTVPTWMNSLTAIHVNRLRFSIRLDTENFGIKVIQNPKHWRRPKNVFFQMVLNLVSSVSPKQEMLIESREEDVADLAEITSPSASLHSQVLSPYAPSMQQQREYIDLWQWVWSKLTLIRLVYL